MNPKINLKTYQSTGHRRQIAILANRSHRTGPDSRLIRLVREFQGFLAHHDVKMTKSTQRALQRCGLDLDFSEEKTLLSGREGGLVSLTDKVIKATKGEAERIDDIVYLIDPRDSTSLYPEANALKRECVNHGVMFLSTYLSAVEWFSLLWSRESNEAFAPEHFGRRRNSQRIALIAHDDLKPQMLKFALLEHAEFLSRFEGIVATGVTCEFLNGERSIDELMTQWSLKKEVKGLNKKQKERIDEDIKILQRLRTEKKSLVVEKVHGGPDGGDVEIAQLVLNTRLSRKDFQRRPKVDKVVFFEDTYVSRPHENDIQLLERTCRLCGESVVCHSDPKAAELWTTAWRQLDGKAGYRDSEPVTVLRAIERTFGWPGQSKLQRVVLAPSSETPQFRPMKSVCRTAAWYVASQIDYLWQQPERLKNPIRVAVGWGLTMREVIDQLKWIIKYRREGDAEYEVPRVIGMALHGLIGLPEPTIEANFLASIVAEAFNQSNPTSVTVPYLLYVHLDESRKKSIMEQLRQADIIVLSCTPMQEVIDKLKLYPVGPALHAVYTEAQSRGAIGEVSGMFIDRDGKQILSAGSVFCGLDFAEMVTMSTEERKRFVLVVGDDRAWIEIATAMLASKLKFTLVTDTGFARGILDLTRECGAEKETPFNRLTERAMDMDSGS